MTHSNSSTNPRDVVPAASSSADAALTTVRDVTHDLVEVVRTTASRVTDTWSVVPVVRALLPELDRVFVERAALAAEVATLRTRRAEAEERIGTLDAQLQARESGWTAERTVLETELAGERERAEMLAEDLARRQHDVALLEARDRRAREQMEGVAARAHADREETLRLAREMVQSAEEARFAVVEEGEALRAALLAEQTRLVEIQLERTRVTQGAAEREAELSRTRCIAEQLEASRVATAAELARARAALVQIEDELLATRHEYQLAQVQIDKLCGAQNDMVEDRANLVAKLHDAREREARLRLRITGLEDTIHAACGGAVPEIPVAPSDDTTSALAVGLSRAEERIRGLEDECAKAKAAGSAATIRVTALQEQARAAEADRVAAVVEAEALRRELAALRTPATLPMPGPRGDGDQTSAPQEPVEAAAENDAPEPVERDAGDPAPVAEPDAEAWQTGADDVRLACDTGYRTIASPAATSVVVVDAVGTWDGATAVVAPDPEVCERVREIAPDVCVVNLAVPGALETARALRVAGIPARFAGCAIAPDGTAGLSLGWFDVVSRPVDPEVVRAQLADVARDGANVIMVGSDSSMQIPLRQGLLQGGMSVRTAWDRKQAAALADAVHPDVVVVDLASEAAGGAELVLEIARRAPAPFIVLVAGGAAHAETFAAALAHAAAAGSTPCAELLAAVAI